MVKLKQLFAKVKMSGESLLEQFARQSSALSAISSEPSIEANICPTCGIAMDICNDDYICKQCKRITRSDRHFSTESQKYSNRDSRRYYSSSDPQREQRDSVYESLVAHREEYLAALAAKYEIPYVPNSSLVDGASELSAHVPTTATLINVAAIYHDIQRKSSENGGTSFVRRGDVKHEILAAILFFECIKGEEMRSKREIAEMMGLRSDGFSRGYEQLRKQAAIGNMDLYNEDKLCEHMIVYYFRITLGAYMDSAFAAVRNAPENSQQYISSYHLLLEESRDIFMRFIQEIINCAHRNHIGTKSLLQSKIVGIIWFIIQMTHYPISAQQIDMASGGIKKGTFLKFSRIILADPRLRRIAKRYFPQLSLPNFIKNFRL